MVWKRSLDWLARLLDRRRGERHLTSELVAYYWDGGVPKAHSIKNITYSGAYLATEERWYVGTIILLTLQRLAETDPSVCINIPCQVVRHGPDGVGLKFMLSSKEELRAIQRLLVKVRRSRGPDARSGTSGQAVVEFALMVPLIFLLIVNALNFGSFIYCWLTVADAVRAAGDYASMGSNTAGSPVTPNVSAIQTLVQNATASLPGSSGSNPVVTACIFNNGTTNQFLTTTACPSGVSSPPADLEPIASGSTITYSTVAVDVTYAFTPFLAGTIFLRFGLPTLPSKIHRRMVVRWP